MINLSTERLTIRDLTINDLENHHELISNNKVMKYLQDIKTNSIEESKENLLKAVNDIKLKDRVEYRLLKNEWKIHFSPISPHPSAS
jgi:hypothetical protein